MTEGMDWEKRDEFDETLARMDTEVDRRRRFETVRGLQGGDVVLSQGRAPSRT